MSSEVTGGGMRWGGSAVGKEIDALAHRLESIGPRVESDPAADQRDGDDRS